MDLLFAQVESLSGGAGWVGAGLLGAVLGWLLLVHLPAQTKQTRELIDSHLNAEKDQRATCKQERDDATKLFLVELAKRDKENRRFQLVQTEITNKVNLTGQLCILDNADQKARVAQVLESLSPIVNENPTASQILSRRARDKLRADITTELNKPSINPLDEEESDDK